MGFSRQEYWSGLPFLSLVDQPRKWKWSHLVMSHSLWPHGLQPTRVLHPWDFRGKSTGVGCHFLLQPCLTHWNYEQCHVRPPKTDGPWWRVLTKCGPLEKGMANHFSILALRTPWTVWKDKKIGHWKMNSPGQQVPNMPREITPESMKRWSQI